MIKNIIFDIGNVLVDFRWRELMDELELTKEDKDRFEVYVFGSKWWHHLDHGTMEEEEVVKHLREDNKEYTKAFDLVWENRDQLVRPYEHSVAWIKGLKEQGYRVYLLSNYPEKLFTMHAQNGSFPFLNLVDGKVVSAFEKKIKPDADIYECLLERYGIKAEECVFLDDREENVQGAMHVGMQAICVKNYEQANEELQAMLNLQSHQTIDVAQIMALVHTTDKIIFDEAAISNIKVKGAADYVTKVDLEVQNYLQKELKRLYPDIGFIGEEQEHFVADRNKSYWILDPIDGTTNLIHHYKMSAVSLGLYENGKITFGIVYNPFTKETFSAVEGKGAYLNGQRIQVSACDSLKDALVSYGSSPYEKENAHELFMLFEKLFLHCADFRRNGSAELDLCYVACGRHEVYLEQNLKPWDYAAGSLILTEAGGSFGAWKEGEKPTFLENSGVLATNGILEQDIRELQKTLLPENHSNKPII